MEVERRHLAPGLVHWLSGLAGGTAQTLVGHPFDTVKVSGAACRGR